VRSFTALPCWLGWCRVPAVGALSLTVDQGWGCSAQDGWRTKVRCPGPDKICKPRSRQGLCCPGPASFRLVVEKRRIGAPCKFLRGSKEPSVSEHLILFSPIASPKKRKKGARERERCSFAALAAVAADKHETAELNVSQFLLPGCTTHRQLKCGKKVTCLPAL